MDKEKTISPAVEKEMVSYLYLNNLFMKTKDHSGVAHIPISVFPSQVPSNLFRKIEFYQVAFNKIIDKMSKDKEFLHTCLSK